MAIRTKLLSWRNINTDSDFSKYIETVSEPWVIEWLAVTANSVAVWKCWCPCERTNWETIYSLVENFSAVTIDTSWTGYVIVEIGQNYIDDWSLINEDWTWVATIKVVQTLPTKNYLQLASISSWTITDSRNMIKKVWELNTAIESLTSQIDDLDTRVEALEEAWAIDHLEESALVWELYTLSNNLFKQLTPTNTNSTLEDCHVWDVAANTEIHIQRIANWEESNKLKLKVKMTGSPTTNLKVEVRKWVKVTVTADTEAYWYWDEAQVIASWSLAYSEFSSSRAEKEFTLNNAINVDKWTLLDIVVYQESSWTKVVNSSNYYIIACDSTQWSEAFSFVSVNGSTRTRSKLMPYCISSCFAQSLLSKVNSAWLKRWAIPFWIPKSVKTIGEIWFIVTYWIIRTSFINKDVYINTSWTITDSSTNQFSYLGVSNAYWDILFNGWDILQKAVKRTQIFSKSESSTTWTVEFTAPSDWFIQYYLRAWAYYAYLYAYIWNIELANVRWTESWGSRSISWMYYIEKWVTVKFQYSWSNTGAWNAYFRSYQNK